MTRSFFAILTCLLFAANGYCADTADGTVSVADNAAGQERTSRIIDTKDPASYVIRRFYAEYVAEWLCGSASDTKSVSNEYVTKSLRKKLKRLYSEQELDYDPFLEAQDCDGHTLDSMRIERDADRPDIRRVYLWDDFNKRYKEIVLQMKLEGDELKINDIESLPAVYK